MTDHYMVEPTACSPAAGWEKGQVENQVQTIRGRFFQPRLRFASLDELNGWLEAECRRWAERQAHPEQGALTVAQALEIERSALQPMLGPFDGFNESEHAVTGTCLISFDRNRYSVLSTMARHTVQRSDEHTSELQSLMRISYAVFCLQKQNHILPKHIHY